jgi:DNA-binding NarL/FixJ family response regulator
MKSWMSAALAILVIASGVCAETFPTRVITVVVPYAADGAMDAVGRVFAEAMRRPLSPENNEDITGECLRAGAGGYLLKSAPDEQIIDAIEALAQQHGYYSSSITEKLLDNGKGRSHLTTREREVLRLIAQGRRGKEIAQMLGLSIRTIEAHRAAGMRKLHLHSIAEVVRYAIQEQLIQT